MNEKTHTLRKKGALICSGAIALLTAAGCCVMLTGTNEGILSVYGLHNLKFFTVVSNLFLGLVSLTHVILAVSGYLEKHGKAQRWTERLIYIGTTAVSLTFVVVVCFFAPSLGLAPLLRDANLYYHLIIPVLAILAFCLFHRDRHIPLWETSLALIPSVLYGVYYTSVLLAKGVHFPDTDWYGFAAGGAAGSAATALGIFLVTWLLALALRTLSGGGR